MTTAYLPRRRSAKEMRRALRSYLLEHGIEPAVIAQVVLAAEEAFINAVTHTEECRACSITVSAQVSGDRISVEIRDRGHGFSHKRSASPRIPDAGRVHGRGVFIMESMMDEVVVRPGREGTTVCMVRRIPIGAGAEC